MLSQVLTIVLCFIASPLVCHPTSNTPVLNPAYDTDLFHGAKLRGSDPGRRQVKDVSSRRKSAGLYSNSTNPYSSIQDSEIISLYAQKHNIAQNLSHHGGDKASSDSTYWNNHPYQLEAFRLLALELRSQDNLCAIQAETKTEPRSLDLGKRLDISLQTPSNILWTAPTQCFIVDMTASKYLPWTGADTPILGTKGLCGCIAVAIVGNGGRIVSHMAASDDMLPQLVGLLTEYAKMHGQYDIQAYIFTPRAGETITPAMATVARVIGEQIRDYIVKYIQKSVVSGWYAPGGAHADNPRLGTMVTTVVQGAIKLWINDELFNE